MQQINGVKMYAIDELADKMPVSIWTLRNYVRKGKLRAIKMGRSYWISEENLVEFLNGTAAVVDVDVRSYQDSTPVARPTQEAAPC